MVLLLAGAMALSACGGSSSSDPQQNAALSGNWQFTLTDAPPGLTATSGLQGGFLLQKNSSVMGGVVYSNTLTGSNTGPCDSGSAPITGTIGGQSVTLTAAAGTETFSLTGTLNSDGSMSGTYTYTPAQNSPCGTVTGQGLNWRAIPVPPLTGSITGSFHTGQTSNSNLLNQDYALTGSLTQGENIGASSATVTGTLSFLDPTTLVSDYPCIPGGVVSVNGQISGDTVILQLIGLDGSNSGQIGVSASQAGQTVFGPEILFNPLPSSRRSRAGTFFTPLREKGIS